MHLESLLKNYWAGGYLEESRHTAGFLQQEDRFESHLEKKIVGINGRIINRMTEVKTGAKDNSKIKVSPFLLGTPSRLS